MQALLANKENRNHSIDFLKGILIILVVIGHSISGELRETFSRYLIYGFHMPLFIFVGGILFSYDLSKKGQLKKTVSKLVKRLLIP